MKKLSIFLVMAIMIVSTLSSFAFAAPVTEKPTVGVESSDPNHGVGIYNGKSSTKTSKDLYQIESFGDLIMEGGCSIEKLASNKVRVAGYTQAFQIVDTLEVSVTLQQWTDGAWKSLKTWDYSDGSTSYVSGNSDYYVMSGYYYRVVATHTANDSTGFDSGTSESSYILVD